MPDEEAEEEDEEDAIEEEETDRPLNPPAAPTQQSEGDPAWLKSINDRLDGIDASLKSLKRSKPRPRPVTEKPEETLTGNRQERKRKRNQRRFLGRLSKKAG